MMNSSVLHKILSLLIVANSVFASIFSDTIELDRLFPDIAHNGSLTDASVSSYNDQNLTTICWRQKTTLYCTINGSCRGYTEYSISIESNSEKAQPNLNAMTQPYQIYDSQTKTTKILDFVTVKRRRNEMVKENTTLECRANHSYTRVYTKFPTHAKVEIKLSPVERDIKPVNLSVVSFQKSFNKDEKNIASGRRFGFDTKSQKTVDGSKTFSSVVTSESSVDNKLKRVGGSNASSNEDAAGVNVEINLNEPNGRVEIISHKSTVEAAGGSNKANIGQNIDTNLTEVRANYVSGHKMASGRSGVGDLSKAHIRDNGAGSNLQSVGNSHGSGQWSVNLTKTQISGGDASTLNRNLEDESTKPVTEATTSFGNLQIESQREASGTDTKSSGHQEANVKLTASSSPRIKVGETSETITAKSQQLVKTGLSSSKTPPADNSFLNLHKNCKNGKVQVRLNMDILNNQENIKHVSKIMDLDLNQSPESKPQQSNFDEAFSSLIRHYFGDNLQQQMPCLEDSHQQKNSARLMEPVAQAPKVRYSPTNDLGRFILGRDDGKMRRTIYFLALLGLGLAQDYNCTAAGRFRYQDPTCRSYYLCALYNGAYVKSNYTCPSTMIFNPTSQTCSASAVCIDNICADLPLVPLFPKIPDPNGPDCHTYIQCIGIPTKYPVIETCPSGLLFDNNLNPEPDCWISGNCTPP